MSCNVTTVSCQRIGGPVVVKSSRVAEEIAISSECVRVEVDVTAERVQMAVAATTERIFENPKVASSIVCNVGVGEFVKWALESLQWLGEDNQVGVTKYNTLIASGDWSLEELEIEELL